MSDRDYTVSARRGLCPFGARAKCARCATRGCEGVVVLVVPGLGPCGGVPRRLTEVYTRSIYFATLRGAYICILLRESTLFGATVCARNLDQLALCAGGARGAVCEVQHGVVGVVCHVNPGRAHVGHLGGSVREGGVLADSGMCGVGFGNFSGFALGIFGMY